MNELKAEQISALAADLKNLNFSVHSLDRLKERGIFISDVQNALMHGEIIEQYPNDYPFPSCLVIGGSCGGKTMHVCCGIGNNKIWIITAYFPATDKWESDMRTRKVVK